MSEKVPDFSCFNEAHSLVSQTQKVVCHSSRLSKADFDSAVSNATSVPRLAHCPTNSRGTLHEWPIHPPHGSALMDTNAAIILLRARAAKKSVSQIGLTADLGGSAGMPPLSSPKEIKDGPIRTFVTIQAMDEYYLQAPENKTRLDPTVAKPTPLTTALSRSPQYRPSTTFGATDVERMFSTFD